MLKKGKKRLILLGVMLMFTLIVPIILLFTNRAEHKKTTNSQSNELAKQPSTTAQPQQPPAPPVPVKPPPELASPVADFKSRITKKSFGTYVTPQNSPVQPEKFIGYHTGVDIEYSDTVGKVAIHAIADGTVVYSNQVSGYGGVVCIKSTVDKVARIVLYGHLAPSSLLTVGTPVTKGQEIGWLGQAYSYETDNERKHLHFAILKNTAINLLGYVPNQSQLASWIDPLSLSFQDKE